MAPCDGAGMTTKDDDGIPRVARTDRGAAPCLAPHEWVFIGCLRGGDGVISRGLARAYEGGDRREGFVRGWLQRIRFKLANQRRALAEPTP